MSDFKIPPISPLLGSTLINYFKILHKQYISPRFYFKVLLTTLVVLIATPFHWWERLVFYRKLSKFKFKNAPVFIIGHWRSGTTLLHNLLCEDPCAGYVTTYQSVFPNNLKSKWLFEGFMRINMPLKRPSDNVELNVKFPQEDEYAFSNSHSNNYYNFFYFPSQYKKYYAKSVHHQGLNKHQVAQWYRRYDIMLKKALINTGGQRLVLKNPVNTARIDKILKLYPEAKFLYIYRNPITVFYSTQRFFQKLLPTIWLQQVDNQLIDTLIFETYNKLMDDYQEQKHLIPRENLLEIKYEELEINPLQEIKNIYSTLLKDDFDSVESYFKDYLKSMGEYKKNRYQPDPSMLDQIKKQWEKYITLYKYEKP